MGKAQEKFLKLLELLNGCREKLFATYNLFVANLEQTKLAKVELGERYEQLLDLKNDLKQLEMSGRPTKTKTAKLKKDAQEIKLECDEQIENIGSGMSDCETCRKTYKHEVALCCDTYNKLKVNGVEDHIVKGYRQQVKLIKRILEKIDTVKESFKSLKSEIKEKKKLFDDLYNKLYEQALSLA